MCGYVSQWPRSQALRLNGRLSSESKATPDPKLFLFLYPSPPGVIEIAQLPLCVLGYRQALGEGLRPRAGPRLECEVLSWLCACPQRRAVPACLVGIPDELQAKGPSSEAAGPGRQKGSHVILSFGSFYFHFLFATIFFLGV